MNKCDFHVDLDGTLIFTDMLYESVVSMFKKNPFTLFFLPFWLLKGKANLKHQIAKRAEVNVALLPYNDVLIERLNEEKRQGTKLYLTTASNQKYAHAIAKYLRIFDGVLASDEKVNLSKSNKLAGIKQISDEFSYAGNSSDDLAIFPSAEQALLVSNSVKLQQKVKAISNITELFKSRTPSIKNIIKGCRVYQWSKNVLLFVPLLMSGNFFDLGQVKLVVVSFISLGLLASATYLLNDMMDLESDRAHKRKKYRPIAYGEISIPLAMGIILLLTAMALLPAAFVSTTLLIGLLGYLLVTLSYTYVLKQYILIDVITLATLYTTRIVIGALVIGVFPSVWLFAFSMFTFLSLALVKRVSELRTLADENRQRTKGRDYSLRDIELLIPMGMSSSFIAVLVVILFMYQEFSVGNYESPEYLWATLPILLYWFSRMWMKTNRGEMHDDPIVFSFRDKGSMVCGAAILLIILFAISA